MRSIPGHELLIHPAGAFLNMTKQAGIGAFFLVEALGHGGVGDIIDAMSPGFKQESIHDTGHVARDTTATLRVYGVVRVAFHRGSAGQLGMTLQAHLIGVVPKLQ